MPKHDSRTADDLFNDALMAGSDEEAAWEAISALHRRGTKEILDRAEVLCRSECGYERRLAANVLGYLGVPTRTFPRESAAVLFAMLLRSEKDAGVLQAIIAGQFFLHEPRAINVATRYAGLPNPNFRHAVVLALGTQTDDAAIGLLILLSADSVSHVRNSATFVLRTQLDVDTAEVRNALVARLDDSDRETRAEAILGLAVRGDCRVVPALRRELAIGRDEPLITEAARLMRHELSRCP